jgi:hypothetical protein
MSPGSGPMSWSVSSVAARSGGVVPVRGSEHAAERDALALHQQGPFHAQLAAVDGAAAGAFPATGGLSDAPVDGQVVQDQATIRS